MSRLRVCAWLLVAAASGCTPSAWKGDWKPPVSERFVVGKAPDGSQLMGTHVTARFNGVNNVSLFEQSWRPSTEPKATIILQHGLKDHGSRYAEVAAALVAHGYAVYAMDLRGHGQSDGARVWIDSFSQYLDDLGTFVASVEKREPGRPLFLFGHSMGGAIVTLFTMIRGPKLAGLALSGPAIIPGADVSKSLIRIAKFLGNSFPGAKVLDLPDENFSRDKAVVANCKADPLISHKKGPARTSAELLRAMETIDTSFPSLTLPVIAMHGAADKITNPDGSKLLYEKVASKDKTLKLYPGLYHDLLHEPEKAQVTADLLGWLDAHVTQ